MSRVSDYLTVASLISGFGVAVLMFRLQREINVQDGTGQRRSMPGELRAEASRIACADLLVIAAILISLLLVVLPLVFAARPGNALIQFSAASCSAACVLLAGYPLAILDHYGILPCANRLDPAPAEPIAWRQCECIEMMLVIFFTLIAVLAFVFKLGGWLPF